MNHPYEDLIQKALNEKAQRLEIAERYRQEYSRTGDPDIIIDLIRSIPHALEENHWLVKIIEKWRIDRKHSLLKKAFEISPGKKRGKKDTDDIYGLTVVEVDVLKSKGLSGEKAFQEISKIRAFSGSEAIKKSYYDMRKKMYETYIEEHDDCYFLTVEKTRISIQGVDIFGNYTFIIPKDPTKRDQVEIRGEGRAIDDDDFQRLRASMKDLASDKD